MILSPELIEYVKKEVDIRQYYSVCEMVTAQHILFKQFTDNTKWKNLTKIIFYILLNEAFGMAYLKDSKGDLGYAIKLLNSEQKDERSVATKMPNDI